MGMGIRDDGSNDAENLNLATRNALLQWLDILQDHLGNAVAGINAASRAMYAMGRTGTLPRPLAHIHTR